MGPQIIGCFLGPTGLKRIEEWKKATILKYIWNLFTKSGSLWVAWVKVNLLKGRGFWQLKIQPNATWSWRKILKLTSFFFFDE
jgi:hypothetical protein